MSDELVIKPHAGPQEKFLACGSDIAVFGGGAGPGKTWALLFDQARWAMSVPGFAGVIFRRTYPEIMNPGALWDESMKLLHAMGGTPTRSECKWTWPNGSWIKFSHLQREDDVHDWQGAQLAVFSLDEGTHFSSSQFWYLISRLRSKCGVRPYCRISCNPDPTSWLAEFISGWIDSDGFPVPGAAEKQRWIARAGGKLNWADTPEELTANDPKVKPLSVSFIPALVTDNPTLLAEDPDYMSKLYALTYVDRARLLDGNWKIRAGGGSFFKRGWFKWLDAMPEDMRWVRYWDRAATEVSETSPDPDWTRGVLIGTDGRKTVIADVTGLRGSPGSVRNHIVATATIDPADVEIALEQDPGQAGVVDVDELVVALSAFAVRTVTPRGHKADRAKPLSSHCEAGNVYLVRGSWNESFIAEAEAFLDNREVKEPPGYHDDQIDAADGGYNFLHGISTPRIRTIS